jgi:uncharacterized protein
MPVWSVVFGAVVGLSLGLTGTGGSIFAVPLLIYGLGVEPRAAIGASLVTIGATALVGFLERLRAGLVDLRSGLLLAAASVPAVPVGVRLGAKVAEPVLLSLFGLLMLVVALRMWRGAGARFVNKSRGAPSDEPGAITGRDSRDARPWTWRSGLLFAAAGLAVGLLTGFFGVGGGLFIVPLLVLAGGMRIERAIGTTLLVMTLVSSTGVVSLIFAGRTFPWTTVGWFTGGSLLGMAVGSRFAARLSGPTLGRLFAGLVLLVALFVLFRNLV